MGLSLYKKKKKVRRHTGTFRWQIEWQGIDFVVQGHAAAHLHYDLRPEGVLHKYHILLTHLSKILEEVRNGLYSLVVVEYAVVFVR